MIVVYYENIYFYDRMELFVQLEMCVYLGADLVKIVLVGINSVKVPSAIASTATRSLTSVLKAGSNIISHLILLFWEKNFWNYQSYCEIYSVHHELNVRNVY